MQRIPHNHQNDGANNMVDAAETSNNLWPPFEEDPTTYDQQNDGNNINFVDLDETSKNPWPPFEEDIIPYNQNDGENNMVDPAETSENPWLLFQKDIITGERDTSIIPHQEDLIMVQQPSEEALAASSVNQNNKKRARRLKRFQSGKLVVQPDTDEGSLVKKHDHNAKERVRRMKLNASYLALRSLLPDSHRSKKKWSAPVVVGKVLEYIPELETEIEDLTQKKEQMISMIEKRQITPIQASPSEFETPTVSVTEVRKGEVIIQICMKRENSSVLSTLIANAEGEGMQIVSASALPVSDDRVCYHLHLHVNGSSERSDYIEVLRTKILSWSCESSSIHRQDQDGDNIF
ncbi:PREDICTED: transcription factor ORG2-like [Nelumbo nucifera]|uniref:BHLH domain-containing protein n=2 Tax=Nelumbo nucifera TaxID=4432 RepID=A0A822XXB4_NELNU|nr:PREDICTED: transcription factor ORG2-like [Nelumbo nucifera]DAD24652.1 TPA_asm: hypothetical protein HUJ06_026116 [Nelumbo nucifera]